ncbi:hypothetical protein EJ08DRAFT_683325 [Tothia fuscella]|uniref:SprT-like domain-containing protein n=1 Tax=Tothia fuscella TaxID=1048955 RepID=A0A9P4TSK5_9PEZI|nr:hypothetical protein EJ08DRAFT_683325 [Tothia fuscella]
MSSTTTLFHTKEILEVMPPKRITLAPQTAGSSRNPTTRRSKASTSYIHYYEPISLVHLPFPTIQIDPVACLNTRRLNNLEHIGELEIILGTLLHEMCHTYIELFTCHGNFKGGCSTCGISKKCRSKNCEDIYQLGLGVTGHGRAWCMLIKALEDNVERLLGIKTNFRNWADLDKDKQDEVRKSIANFTGVVLATPNPKTTLPTPRATPEPEPRDLDTSAPSAPGQIDAEEMNQSIKRAREDRSSGSEDSSDTKKRRLSVTVSIDDMEID